MSRAEAGKRLAEAAFEHAIETHGALQLAAELAVSDYEPERPKPQDWPAGTPDELKQLDHDLQTISLVEEFRFDRVEVAPAKDLYIYVWRSIWADANGHKRRFAETPVEQRVLVAPWQDGFDLPFPARNRLTLQQLRLKLADQWQRISGAFIAELRAGTVIAVGRAGSPLADPPTAIPSDAWAEIEIADWSAGVADTAEQTIYALRVGTEMVPTPARRKNKTLVDHTEDALHEAHPNGIPGPSQASDDMLLADALKTWGNRYYRKPNKEAVRRASGRRRR